MLCVFEWYCGMREIYATFFCLYVWLYKSHIVDYFLLGDFLKYDKVIQNDAYLSIVHCTSATFVATAMSEVLEIVHLEVTLIRLGIT